MLTRFIRAVSIKKSPKNRRVGRSVFSILNGLNYWDMLFPNMSQQTIHGMYVYFGLASIQVLRPWRSRPYGKGWEASCNTHVLTLASVFLFLFILFYFMYPTCGKIGNFMNTSKISYSCERPGGVVRHRNMDTSAIWAPSQHLPTLIILKNKRFGVAACIRCLRACIKAARDGSEI